MWRGQRVILDSDVARLYGVNTMRVNEAVKNNPDKFPDGYIITLNNGEWETSSLRSKISTLKTSGRGEHTKYPPKAFTEKGLYMLATILKSPKATQTTIAIIETFAKIIPILAARFRNEKWRCGRAVDGGSLENC